MEKKRAEKNGAELVSAGPALTLRNETRQTKQESLLQTHGKYVELCAYKTIGKAA